MRKSTFFFASLLLFGAFSNAQIQDIKDWQSRYDNLEPYVESGILIDRNPQSFIASQTNFNPMQWSTGIDSLCNAEQFKDLCLEQYTFASTGIKSFNIASVYIKSFTICRLQSEY